MKPTNFVTVNLLLSLISFSIQGSRTEHPDKVDLGLIFDASLDMGARDFTTAKEFVKKLLDNMSISPGTTRVGVYTVDSKIHEVFHFKSHVNRECVLKALDQLNYSEQDKTYDFQTRINDVFEILQTGSRDVIHQRKIFLFLTNSADEIPAVKNDIKVSLTMKDFVGAIVIGSNKNKDKISFNESDDQNDLIKLDTKSRTDEAAHYNGILNENFPHNDNMQTRKTSNTSDFFLPVNDDEGKEQSNKFGNVIKTMYYSGPDNNMKYILNEMNIGSHSYTKCYHEGKRTRDECNRECTCRNGTLQNCYRIRKEFTAMSKAQRRRYLRAYKTLTTTSPYKEIYERYVFMHYKYFCWGIHTQDLFLPWHRWFISVMEDLLKQIDCRVTLAYWDWSYVSQDPWNRTNLWRSTDDGLGSNGNKYKGYCVQNGMFRESQWQTPYWEDPMDIILSAADQIKGKISEQVGHLAFCLRRAFKGLTPSRKSVLRTLNIKPKKFKDFDLQIRHNYHDRIHNIVGGTMCTHYAANTPEFWLHHAFLDKIWYLWQQKSEQHKFVHFLQRNKTKMMGCPHTQKELIDSHNLPRCIKVKYSKFPTIERGKRSMDDIDDMARTPDRYWKTYLNESWYGTFPDCSRSDKEKARAKYLHRILDRP